MGGGRAEMEDPRIDRCLFCNGPHRSVGGRGAWEAPALGARVTSRRTAGCQLPVSSIHNGLLVVDESCPLARRSIPWATLRPTPGSTLIMQAAPV